MKTIALIASHKRDDILQDCITCIKPQVDDIVLVGSSDWIKEADTCNIAKRIAKKNDLLYVDHSNKVLGVKWQSGLNRARIEKPDAVLICGSDDLLADNWVERCLIKDRYESIHGVNQWKMYNPTLNKLCAVEYKTREDFLGAGRIITSVLLERVDWQIFPIQGGIGCDLYSWRTMLSSGIINTVNISGNCDLLSVKGAWGMMDTWEQILSAESLDIGFYPREYNKEYLAKYFPNIDFDKYKK